MIHYIKGEDLINHVKEYDVVLVGSGINNSLGNGFHRKVYISFPEVSKADWTTGYNDKRKLGLTNSVHGNPEFVICYITPGRYRPDLSPDSLDYEALEKCLKFVSSKYQGKKIAMTVIGGSEFDGGGDIGRIKAIIERFMSGLDVYVYEYEQVPYMAEYSERWHDILDHRKDMTRDEYVKKRNALIWEENFGVYSEAPDCSVHELEGKIRKKKEEIQGMA